MNDHSSISIVVPVLNEEGSLEIFYRETSNALNGFPEWEMIFIDDGSGDESWDSLSETRQLVSSGVYIAHFEVTEDYVDSQTQNLIFQIGNQTLKKFVIIR